MGNFYTSHTLRGPSQDEVIAWLGNRPAYVSKTERSCTTVLDQACESQDRQELADLAHRLSEHFRCPVLAVLNHDDDVLYFELYEDGKKTDEYNSAPSYFDVEGGDDEPVGGDASRLATAFGVSDVPAIETVLRTGADEYVFQFERHRDLASALSLPSFSVAVGYTYAEAGDFPPGVAADVYVRTGA